MTCHRRVTIPLEVNYNFTILYFELEVSSDLGPHILYLGGYPTSSKNIILVGRNNSLVCRILIWVLCYLTIQIIPTSGRIIGLEIGRASCRERVKIGVDSS